MTYELPINILEQHTRLDSRRHLDWPARIAFALTLSRIPATALTLFLLVNGRVILACWTVAVAVILDIVDGIVFNLSCCAQNRLIRENRRILDATMDRVFICGTLLVALSTIQFPLAVYSVIMIREILLSITCVYPYLKKKTIYAPNLPSRIGSALIAVQFITFIRAGSIPVFMTLLFCVASVTGLAFYVGRPKRI